jgi:hypothetical protein
MKIIMRKRSLSLIIILYILFNGAHLNNINYDSSVQNVLGHNFTPNNNALFVASLDQFQTESKLVNTNLVNNNLSLAQNHADKAVNIFNWDLMVKITDRDKKIGEDLKIAVENLRNLTSSFSTTSTSVQGEKQELEQSNQLVASINTNLDKIIAITETQKKSEDSNYLNQVIMSISNIFSPKEDSSNESIHPMRFAELLDSVLRNYGYAYGVDFDMTDMSNMAMMQSDKKTSETNSLIDMGDYQSAQGLAAKSLEIFDNYLKRMMSNYETSDYRNNLESGLIQLNSSIKDKASPMDIMMIVHSQIHPNLIGAFDIKLLSSA